MGKTALVLAGGGSRGAYEIGVWQALREMDIKINIVVGTSIGAINGAMIVQDDFEEAQKMWKTIQTSEVFAVPIEEVDSMKRKIMKTYSTFMKDFFNGGTDTSPLKHTLEKHFDEKKIRNSKIEYGVVTVEMDTLKPVEIFVDQIPKGQIIDYVLASASIYPAVKPYEINGVRYIDGTYHDNLPIKMALERKATKIIAVDLEAFGKVDRDLLESLNNVTYIKSYWDLGVSLVFDSDIIKKIERYGYLDTMKAFGVFDGYAYTFIKNSNAEIAKEFKRDGVLAKKIGIAAGINRYSISDTLLSAKWKKIVKERNIRSEKPIADVLISAEIAAEILEIDPTKIYSIDVMNTRIKENLKKVKINAMEDENAGNRRAKAVFEKIELLDKKKRMKHIALELKNLIKADTEIAAKRIASVYTEEFFGALYIAIKDL